MQFLCIRNFGRYTKYAARRQFSMSRSRGDLLYRATKGASPLPLLRFTPVPIEIRILCDHKEIAGIAFLDAKRTRKEGERARFDNRYPSCKLSTLSLRFINYSPEHRSTFYAIILLGRNILFVTGMEDSNLRFKSKE